MCSSSWKDPFSRVRGLGRCFYEIRLFNPKSLSRIESVGEHNLGTSNKKSAYLKGWSWRLISSEAFSLILSLFSDPSSSASSSVVFHDKKGGIRIYNPIRIGKEGHDSLWKINGARIRKHNQIFGRKSRILHPQTVPSHPPRLKHRYVPVSAFSFRRSSCSSSSFPCLSSYC